MLEDLWCPESNRILVCIDDYQNGVPFGRFYDASLDMKEFNSLTQFLIKVEDLLEDRGALQSYTTLRTFSPLSNRMEAESQPAGPRRGDRATFELKILFRQHASWQGTVVWKERRQEQSFRSVLELIHLMDSALRAAEGGLV